MFQRFFIFLFIPNIVMSWFVENGNIYYDNDILFSLRGLNWFGYEGDCNIVQGLWINSIDHYFSILANDIQVNTLRIPFSDNTIRNWDQHPKPECLTANEWMNDISIKDSFHVLFQKAADAHISIVLDFHTIGGDITDYLFSDTFTMDDTFRMWQLVMQEFIQYDNLLAIDIKNEPHGDISWSDWGSYASSIITYIRSQFPNYRGLFFIEGIQDKNSRSVWGGSFTDLHKWMMNIMPNNKVVFSPHIYGNSVRGDEASDDTYALFDYWFGDLRFKFPNNAIVIGEIGGMNIGDDLVWHTKIKNYLKKRGLNDAIYWCMNPNSGDTGGIMEYDWQTLNTRKIEFIHDLQPNITLISYKPPTPY